MNGGSLIDDEKATTMSLSTQATIIATNLADDDHVTIPTRIELVTDDGDPGHANHDMASSSPAAHDSNDTFGAGQQQRPSTLKSATQAVLRLTAEEEKLFRVIVETAEAFARGQISLPSEEPESTASQEPSQEQEQQQDNQNESILESNNSNSTANDLAADSPPPTRRCRRKRPTVRVAGGWVRDKLLGLSTHDVDLAVDTLTGVQFAQLVHAYADATNQPDITRGHKIGIIACNPEQSKHLETAALQVCGMDVDMANLRSQETYHHDSRIPTVSFGTPLEDAERRDFTINALFFNLHSRCVEDWTRRGMVGLFQGQLVTPLEPIQTFLDDPLRVLRAIRFAVRFQFQIQADVEAACRKSEIHQALRRKVSRERVGKELQGMLSGTRANPTKALHTIHRLQLSSSVFTLPVVGVDFVTAVEGQIILGGGDAGRLYYDKKDDDKDMQDDNDSSEHSTTSIQQQAGWTEAEELLWILPQVLESHEKAEVQFRKSQLSSSPQPVSAVDPQLLPVAVFLLPFRTLRYQEKNKTERSFPFAQYIYQYSLKFKQSDTKAMTLLQENVDAMAVLLRASVSSESPVSRLEAGLLLRTCKHLWPTCLLLATVLLVREQHQENESKAMTTNTTTAKDDQDDIHKTSIHKGVDWNAVSNAVWASIIKMGLDECWKMKPLMDGKALIRSLKLPKGPLIGQFLEEQVRWMLQNPMGTKDDCQAHLKHFQQNLQQETQSSIS